MDKHIFEIDGNDLTDIIDGEGGYDKKDIKLECESEIFKEIKKIISEKGDDSGGC